MTNETILPTYHRNDPVWFHKTIDAEPEPAFFIRQNKHKGITVELAGNKQQQCSYANITRREVVEVE